MIPPELAQMLDDIGREPAERTRMLVAADLADETGFPSLAKLLRTLASPETFHDILATGSRVYGTPRPDSDWDWVIRLSYLPSLYRLAADSCTKSGREYQGVKGIDAALRFGPVNLLVVTTRDQFDAWEQGTKLLIAERESVGPRPRERAVEVFQAKFDFEGFKELTDTEAGAL